MVQSILGRREYKSLAAWKSPLCWGEGITGYTSNNKLVCVCVCVCVYIYIYIYIYIYTHTVQKDTIWFSLLNGISTSYSKI